MAKAAAAVEENGEKLLFGEWPFEWRMVELEELYVDQFQRPVSERWLAPRVERFNPGLFGTITVNLRPKSERRLFSVVDGQHRSELARRAGVHRVPANVFEGLTIEDEATLFSELQRERRSITPLQRFRADVVAKRPQALAIQRMVRAAGYEFGDADAPEVIKAVRAVEQIYEASPERLIQVLRLVRNTWGGMLYATNETMLKGVEMFIIGGPGKPPNPPGHAEVDEARFQERLGGVTPSEIHRRASALKDTRGIQTSSPRFAAEVIEYAYSSSGRARRGPVAGLQGG